MTIKNRLCIRSAGSLFWLPPYNLEMPRPRAIMNVMSRLVPFGGMDTNYCRRHGYTIDVQGHYKEGDVYGGLVFEQGLIDALYDEIGQARVVEYCQWSGSSNVPGIYRQCRATSYPEFTGKRQEARQYKLTLQCDDRFSPWAAFENGTTPGTSPYENYVFNGEEGDAPVPMQQSYPIVFRFGGVAETVSAGNQQVMQKAWKVRSDGAHVRIRGLSVIGCDAVVPGSVATVLRVSGQPWNTAVDYIQVSLAAGAGTAAEVSGSLTLATGATLYAWVQSSGGLHGGIELKAEAVSA